jgi:hypothetical protein
MEPPLEERHDQERTQASDDATRAQSINEPLRAPAHGTRAVRHLKKTRHLHAHSCHRAIPIKSADLNGRASLGKRTNDRTLRGHDRNRDDRSPECRGLVQGDATRDDRD